MKKELVDGLSVVVKENPWHEVGTFYFNKFSGNPDSTADLSIDEYIYGTEIKPDGVFIEQVYKVEGGLVWRGKTMWRILNDKPKSVKIQQQHLDGEIRVYFTCEEAQKVIDSMVETRKEKYGQDSIYRLCEHAYLSCCVDVSDMKPKEVQGCVDQAKESLKHVLDKLKA